MKFKLFIAVIFLTNTSVWAKPAKEEGEIIFTTRCSSCHNVNKTVVGPALAGVDQRHNIDWIVNFVRSSQTLVKSGDKDAVALYEQFNKIPMPDHSDLNADDVKSIVDYIKSAAVPVEKNAAPFARPGKLMPGYLPLSIENDAAFFISYLTAVAMLVIVLAYAVNVNTFIRKNKKGQL